MAIRSNPAKRKKAAPVVDLEARRFIESAPDDMEPPQEPEQPKSAAPAAGKKKVVVMKMPTDIVDRIDQAARARGISRTAYVTDRMVSALKEDEEG
jgi:hypothetical protein